MNKKRSSVFGYEKRTWIIVSCALVGIVLIYRHTSQSRYQNLLACFSNSKHFESNHQKWEGCSLDKKSQKRISSTELVEASKYGDLTAKPRVRVFLDSFLRAGYISVDWERVKAKGETEYRFIGKKIEFSRNTNVVLH